MSSSRQRKERSRALVEVCNFVSKPRNPNQSGTPGESGGHDACLVTNPARLPLETAMRIVGKVVEKKPVRCLSGQGSSPQADQDGVVMEFCW